MASFGVGNPFKGGLLGMGGVSGLGGMEVPAGLLGPYYSPEQMRRNQFKRGLLNAGIAMLQNGKGSTGEVIGNAFAGGLRGYDDAQTEYMNQAYTMQQLEEKAREREQVAQQEEKVQSWLETLSPEDRAMAEAYPDAFAEHYMKASNGGDTPASIQEYEYAKKNGFKGSFQDWQMQGARGAGYFGTPLPYTDGENGFGYALAGKTGGSTAVPAPDGGAWLNPYDKAFQATSGKEAGKARGEAIGDLPGARVTASRAQLLVDDVVNDPNLDSAIGYKSYLPDALSSNAMIDVRRKLDRLGGQAFLEARQMLKGGGAITDFESKKAETAYSTLQRAVIASDPKIIKSALTEFMDAVNTGVQKLEATAGVSGSGGGEWSVEEVQ